LLPKGRKETAARVRTSGLFTREFIRFVVFGAVNTVLAIGAYLLLLKYTGYAIAYTVSYAVGILISYGLNTKFVFKEPFRLSGLLKFPLVYLVQYLLGLGLLFLLVDLAHFDEVTSGLVVPVLTIPVTYFLSRYILVPRIPGRES